MSTIFKRHYQNFAIYVSIIPQQNDIAFVPKCVPIYALGSSK